MNVNNNRGIRPINFNCKPAGNTTGPGRIPPKIGDIVKVKIFKNVYNKGIHAGFRAEIPHFIHDPFNMPFIPKSCIPYNEIKEITRRVNSGGIVETEAKVIPDRLGHGRIILSLMETPIELVLDRAGRDSHIVPLSESSLKTDYQNFMSGNFVNVKLISVSIKARKNKNEYSTARFIIDLLGVKHPVELQYDPDKVKQPGLVLLAERNEIVPIKLRQLEGKLDFNSKAEKVWEWDEKMIFDRANELYRHVESLKNVEQQKKIHEGRQQKWK